MASVADVKAQLIEANARADEAWRALQAAKEQLAGALHSVQMAVELAAAAYDGSEHELALSAVAQFSQSEEHVRVAYAAIDERAQDAILAGQNAAEVYIRSM